MKLDTTEIKEIKKFLEETGFKIPEEIEVNYSGGRVKLIPHCARAKQLIVFLIAVFLNKNT